jgi:hypothetical protein
VSAAGVRQRAEQLTRTAPSAPADPLRSSRCAKVQAAFIGPTVCELEGPMPILNRSKTLTAMPGGAPGFGDWIVACQNATMKTAGAPSDVPIPEPLILYARADCHLCDQVITMLDRAGLHWRPVDIDDDPELLERYGLRIPVLRRPDSGRELFYPFCEQRLLRFAAEGEDRR